MSGYAAAIVVVLVWAAYPVATRAGVTGPFTPQDLMLLRFGVGAALFLPWAISNFRAIRGETWLRGVPLALLQGAGMAALVICGLQFAPATHAAALGPGVAPAWAALLGYLVYSRRPSARMVAGAALCATGVVALSLWSASGPDASMLAGDAMFVAASGLGSLYVLQLRKWGIDAIQGAAIVTLYSAMLVVPWHFWDSAGSLWQIAPSELLWQVLWQGVLIGCIALIAFNHAITRLGPERASALVALVPALSAVLGIAFLGEIASSSEIAGILAISAGVVIGALAPTAAARRPAAQLRNRRLADYSVPGNAP